MEITALEFYTNSKTKAEADLVLLKKKIAINSIFRLLTFLLTLFCLFGLIKISVLWSVIGTVGFLVVFLTLVKKHLSLQKKKLYVEQVEKISNSELDASKHNFDSHQDGVGYSSSKHSYSYDLDVFGKGSIFQMLNRSVTKSGEEKLAQRLKDEHTDAGNIQRQQDCIKELSSHPDLLINFRATGLTSGIIKEDNQSIRKWLTTESLVHNKTILRVIAWLFPAITLLALALTLYNSSNSPFLILMFLINIGVISLNMRKINQEHALVSSLLKGLTKYRNLIKIIEKEDLKSELWQQSMDELKQDDLSASVLLNSLTKIVSSLDSRLNFIVAIFLEGFMLWDLHCLFRLDAWNKKYGERLPNWLEQVAEIDSLISCAGYAFLNNDFNYPNVSAKSQTVLESKDLGHPIIPREKRVCNDFSVSNKGAFVIITGANMAGKSTFLRAVGVNLVLAKAGLPVCASSFEFTPITLFTSMRTSDSLVENESYFYAELLRLKQLMDRLESKEELFIILDEILKGTNSVDKQRGSQSALEKIIKLGGTGIIATHDLALTQIEDKFPNKVKNQCFEIDIDGAKISFDYKLYEGVTQKMNAMLLMEQMGIIEV